MEGRTVRLASCGLVHAPGVFRWAMNGWAFKKDRKGILNLLNSWKTDFSDNQWDAVLTGKIPHQIDGDVVVIQIPAGA